MLSFQRQNVSVSSQALFCLELSTLLEEGEEKPGEWRRRERNPRASGEGRVGVGRETAGRPTGEPDLTSRAKGHWQATHNYSTKLRWVIEYSVHSRIIHTAFSYKSQLYGKYSNWHKGISRNVMWKTCHQFCYLHVVPKLYGLFCLL